MLNIIVSQPGCIVIDMAKKNGKIPGAGLFALLLFVAVLLYFAPQSIPRRFQFGFIRAFGKPLRMCRSFSLFGRSDKSLANAVSRNKYIKLRNHLANSMQWLRQERQNVEKLSGIYNKSAWKGTNFVLADIITVFIDASRSKLIINRGKNDGLSPGQFVLGDYSVIGTISGLDSRTAMVTLVTDPGAKTAVNIAEADVDCIMKGNGSNCARIELVPEKHKIKAGDIVYVRKKPGFLGAPMIVGTVSRCSRDKDNPLLWDIAVAPACDTTRLSNVTVMIMDSDESGPADATEASSGKLSMSRSR